MNQFFHMLLRLLHLHHLYFPHQFRIFQYLLLLQFQFLLLQQFYPLIIHFLNRICLLYHILKHRLKNISQNAHHTITRSKAGISKHKVLLINNETEPNSVDEALQVPHWKHAIQEEIDALHRTNNWSLVFTPPNKNIIG